MADEPEVKPGETPVDEPKGSEAAGETATGEKPEEAQARLAAEREQFLNDIASRVVAQMRSTGPTTPPPPTPAAGPLADLEREAAAIQAEEAALKDQYARDGGWTADTLVRRQDLTDRKSAWRAEASLRAVRMSETQTRVEKAGSEPGWLKFYDENKHRGDVDILRAAWERDNAREPEPKPQPKFTEPRKPAPDVSAPSEVSSVEKKARTMTSEQVRAHKERLESEGRHKELREFDSSLRDGTVLMKG